MSGSGPEIGEQWPCAEHFAALAAHRPVVPVVRRLLADGATPLGLYRALAAGRPGTFLLESAQLDGSWARYSIVGVRAAAVLSSDDGTARWTGPTPPGCPASGQFTDVLAASYDALRCEDAEGLPPLTGGFVGAIGYDVVRSWERIDAGPAKPSELPDAYLALTGDLAVLDHKDGTVYLISNVVTGGTGFDVAAAYRSADERLTELARRLQDPVPQGVSMLEPATGDPLAELLGSRNAAFEEAVGHALAAIEDGEVFQLVLSQRFVTACDADPLDVYRALRLSNPSPYLYLLYCEDAAGEPFAVVGASPEALVKVIGTHVHSHPIAGTRPRGASPEADLALEAELLADDKERAEHLMLVDLARNDLARVCEPDSIGVAEFMAVERYSHVMHLVSTVTGTLQDQAGPLDVLRAAFPAGTLTGAPKIRAMQLIDELEPTRRGIYGGVVGYLSFAGNLDTAIAIRSAVLRPGRAVVQAGAGLVADSVPPAEDAECRAKASAVIAAIDLAGRLRAPHV